MSEMKQKFLPGVLYSLLKYFCLLAIFSLTSLNSSASGNAVVGAKKAAVCINCHPANGITKDPLAPKLNGQYKEFIHSQTMPYISGKLVETEMGKAINKTKLNTKDISDIAAYYSKLPMMSGNKTLTDQAKLGETIYKDNRCRFCHDDNYDGSGENENIYGKKTARIGGQNKAYLFKIMKDIQEDTRKADAFKMMEKALIKLTDEEIDALAEFLSTL